MYGKVVLGHVVCPLYGGCLYLGESVMGGATVAFCNRLNLAIWRIFTHQIYNRPRNSDNRQESCP